MLRALSLLLFPFRTWEKIVAANRSVWAIGLFFLLPLLVAGCLVEGYSLIHWGEIGQFGRRMNVGADEVQRYVLVKMFFYLTVVLAGAAMLSSVARSFNVRATYQQTFTVISYGFTPILLTIFLDAIPILPSWICWGMGVAGAVSVLYHGIGLGLKPEQTKGFGLYLVAILIVFMSGLAHFIALSVLHRRIWSAGLGIG